jgi:hypothetical protein
MRRFVRSHFHTSYRTAFWEGRAVTLSHLIASCLTCADCDIGDSLMAGAI